MRSASASYQQRVQPPVQPHLYQRQYIPQHQQEFVPPLSTKANLNIRPPTPSSFKQQHHRPPTPSQSQQSQPTPKPDNAAETRPSTPLGSRYNKVPAFPTSEYFGSAAEKSGQSTAKSKPIQGSPVPAFRHFSFQPTINPTPNRPPTAQYSTPRSSTPRTPSNSTPRTVKKPVAQAPTTASVLKTKASLPSHLQFDYSRLHERVEKRFEYWKQFWERAQSVRGSDDEEEETNKGVPLTQRTKEMKRKEMAKEMAKLRKERKEEERRIQLEDEDDDSSSGSESGSETSEDSEEEKRKAQQKSQAKKFNLFAANSRINVPPTPSFYFSNIDPKSAAASPRKAATPRRSEPGTPRKASATPRTSAPATPAAHSRSKSNESKENSSSSSSTTSATSSGHSSPPSFTPSSRFYADEPVRRALFQRKKVFQQVNQAADPIEARVLWEEMKDDMWKQWEQYQQKQKPTQQQQQQQSQPKTQQKPVPQTTSSRPSTPSYFSSPFSSFHKSQSTAKDESSNHSPPAVETPTPVRPTTSNTIAVPTHIKSEKEREEVTEQITREISLWASKKTIFTLLNQLTPVTNPPAESPLSINSSYAQVYKLYKKCLLRIHPDKHIDERKKIRATEIFKVVNQRFSEYKQSQEREGKL